ncbi:MAG: peroxiredoxin-like family protein [Candidatus Sulfotelmatobacter sp.]
MKWRSLDESSAKADARPLREIYAERKELIAKYVPAETQAVHAQAVAELKAEGIAGRTMPVGAKTPQFELPDHDGRIVRSAELLARGRLVLCFIRGRWCPFCVGQMESMNLVASSIAGAGASLIAISPQTVKQSYFMHDQHKLRFPLLSDAGNNVARQFGLTYRVPTAQEAVYRRAFVNLPFTNGDDSWELPIPATFIVDRDGTILYASANEDYTERPEPTYIVECLSSRAAAKPA